MRCRPRGVGTGPASVSSGPGSVLQGCTVSTAPVSNGAKSGVGPT